MATKLEPGMAVLDDAKVEDRRDVKDLTETIEDISGTLDPAAEKRLVRKIDFHLIPMLFVLYLCAFIDRYALILLLGEILADKHAELI